MASVRVGSRLSSSAAILSASNFGSLWRGRGGRRGGSCGATLASCFLAFSCFSLSAIGSILGGGLGSALASCFFSGGLTLGSGGGSGVLSTAALTSFFSTLAFGCSTGLGSAFFSTSGFGFSTLGASLMPLVICEKSFSLMNSTGSASVGGASTALPE